MNFEMAISALKKGECVRRGWWPPMSTGKSVLVLHPGGDNALIIGERMYYSPSFKFTPQIVVLAPRDRWIAGWSPTITDMLAEDWSVVTPSPKEPVLTESPRFEQYKHYHYIFSGRIVI